MTIMFFKQKIKFCCLVIALILCRYSQARQAPVENFPVRGFHLDLRIQVMKPEALKAFAAGLSKSGINTLIMEYEATFPYEGHPLIPNRYAYTKEEIKDFVKYCNTIGIDVIPLQQSFGHLEYLLRNNRYTKLREDQKDYSQVCPLQEDENKKLFTELYHELAEVHSSKYIHIGCDETRLLGHCPRCKAKVAKEGVGKLYGDYVKMLCDIVIKMGKIPVLWADIALKYPDALKELPKQTIFVDWNYGWGLDKFGDHAKLMQSGFEIWGAPSLRSSPDNYNITTWEKHFINIHDFVPTARKLGYKGMVMTSWSTSGVYSTLYESAADIIDLYAIRRVYPLTGFNILLAAYLKALSSPEPLDVTAFAKEYTKTTYGFDDRQAALFWAALKAAPYQVSKGKVSGAGISISQLTDSARWVVKTFNGLKPLKNKREYEHYKLIAGTRLQYLIYQEIEDKINKSDFTVVGVPGIIKQLKDVIAATELLNKQYIELNKDSFYTSELEQDNQLRIIKMKLLYDRLTRNR